MDTVVLMLCALALAIGLADPAPRALAAAADASALLPTDRTPEDGNDRALFLVPALGAVALARRSRSVGPASQVPWQARHGAISDLARAPPR